MKKALVCVSFGTGAESGRADLQAVEAALQAAAPDRLFTRACASPAVRAILRARGVASVGLSEALEALAARGVEDVAVQPAYLLYGGEYDKIRAETARWQGCFACLRLGEPLLAGTEDLQRVAQALAEAWPPVPGEALILMGHGTPHFAGMAYAALQSAFALQGRRDVFVVVPRGWPTLEAILPALRAGGYGAAHLVPLLLTAGAHACRDMAGEAPGSLKRQLQAAGLSVRCTLQGLGSLTAIQRLYCEKLARLLE